jgi:hypothetical protein
VVERLTALFAKHWWLPVVLVWALTRLVSTIGFLWAASIQGPSFWYPYPNPAYFDFLNIWDVEWYHRIFDGGLGTAPGYPLQLPTDGNGVVMQNAWAFMPGFPMLVRLLKFVTLGLVPWAVLSATTNLILSFALALMIYKLFSLRFDAKVSLWGVAFFGLWCASPVLQAGYAETLGFLLLAGGLYFLIQHRYLAALPWLIGLSITRPGMISFAAALGGMWLVRWFKHRNGADEFPTTERRRLAALTAASGLLGLAWPIIAWIATGRADAYTVTELAWRTYDPNAHLALMDGWFALGASLWGEYWGSMFVVLVVLLAAGVLFLPSVKALGNELRLWVAAYFLYLLLVFNPQSSTWRILMPAFPLMAALAFATRRSRPWVRWGIVAALIVSQFVWLSVCWVYVNPDYTPP